ncbi:MAG: biotin transporter BioY [Lachnospiraceae bacterium]|nr:biotin transporter BioY [Lachnospiraceae bacterium]
MSEIKGRNSAGRIGHIGKNVYSEGRNSKQKLTTKNIALIAVMTAVTCVLAPLSIPIGPVPISLTTVAIYFGLYILGTKRETISCIVYMLIGLAGLPVFSGFTGGPGKLIGPTGGYMMGFVPMAIIAGLVIDKTNGKFILDFLAMVAGTAVCYAFGTIWLAYQGQMDFTKALFLGVIPFIPGDLIKMVLAAFFGARIRNQLNRAGLR